MAQVESLREKARLNRDLAARARRLARGLTLLSDRERLHRHAEDLERQATEWDHEATHREKVTLPVAPAPGTVQVQQQQQQSQGSEIPGASKPEGPGKSS